jgi:hypothetical protein
MNAEHIATLRQYLAIHVELREKHRDSMVHPDWLYAGMEDFVLKEGTVFREISPYQPLSRGERNRYKPRFIKHCFENSYRAAVASRGKLRYVEGFAHSQILPVHHAWNIDEKDRVVDTTWCGVEDDPLYRPPVGTAYIGCIFDLSFVRAMRTNDNTSVIDQWQKGWPVLKIPYTPNTEVAA